MNARKTLRPAGALLIVFLIGYFYSLEVRKNWLSLQAFTLDTNVPYLIISLSLYVLSYLLETFAWQVCINRHLGRRELGFSRSIAIVNSSGLLKYLPGRIWTYAAQLVWLKKYGISKPVILYVNLICIAGSVIVSLYLGLFYLALYTDWVNTNTAVASFAALILFNIAYIKWNSPLMNKAIGILNRLLGKEIQPLTASLPLLLFVQFVYLCSWSLMGFGGYFLAEGIGLAIPSGSMIAVLASMALSWLAGYFAVISPGGIGVREGMMLLMLNNVVSAQAALIFPIASRIMYLAAEALMGLAALWFGVRHGVFSSGKSVIKADSDF